jgi:O-antigen ligase
MIAAGLVFLDHPFLGVGPGMFDREMAAYSQLVGLRNIITTRRAHSLYLGVAAENGLFGLLTLLAILLYTLYRLSQSRRYWLARKNLRLANLSTGFFLAIIGYMVTGFFLHFAYIRYFWLIMALASVASRFDEEDVIVEKQPAG